MGEAANAKDKVALEVEAQFRALEEAGAKMQPGLNELLQAYGTYEAAIKQADEYFALLNPTPTFTTKNSST
ncbi:MAG: hypothetical protein M3O46_13965 [Myxococcota bacterium]|nr:hypothetical protein [Myxococcota bacterium]